MPIDKNISDEQVESIIDYLMGSCETLYDGIKTITGDTNLCEDNLTEKQLERINEEVFLCDQCGWWFELGEECCATENCGEGLCNDCCSCEE